MRKGRIHNSVRTAISAVLTTTRLPIATGRSETILVDEGKRMSTSPGLLPDLLHRRALTNFIKYNVCEADNRGARYMYTALLGLGSVLVTTPSPALSAISEKSSQSENAQPQSSPPATAPTGAPSLRPQPVPPAEIVITAQKRRERLLDAPQSVTALSGTDLVNSGQTQLRDFAKDVPGLTFTTLGAGYNQVTLRGVTTGNFDIDPTVGIYVDEVPIGSSSAFAEGARLALDSGLFDIDRVEVLRGPQGTLYGASTMGGLIKYVTKAPQTTGFSGEAQAGLSATHDGEATYDLSGDFNVPLVSDVAAFRASGFYSRDGGYVDNVSLRENDVNSSRRYGGHAAVLIKPDSRLSIRLDGYMQHISRSGLGTVNYTLAGQPVDGSLDQRRLMHEPFESHFLLGSGTINYDFGPANFTSITSYQTIKSNVLQDISGAYVPLLGMFGLNYGAIGYSQKFLTEKFTEEARVTSKSGSPIEWIIGGFYTHETSHNHQTFVLEDLAGQPAPNILFNYSAPTLFKEAAVFGDVTWHITSKFDATVGTRYAHNDQESTQIGSGLLIGSAPTRKASDGVFTYLANARYKFSPDAMFYLRYATGYRPGGPNFVTNDLTTGLPIGPTSFGPDRLSSYEGGFKAESRDRAFAIDVDGYYINWKNFHITVIRGGFSGIANAPGGAHILGSELTLTARPLPRLQLSGAFAYQHAVLAQNEPDLGGLQGERLPNVPRFTATLKGQYTIADSPARPRVGVSLAHVSDRYATFNHSPSSPQYRLPAYTSLDLSGAVSFGPVDLQLYVNNVFDTRGQLSAFSGYSAPGTTEVAVTQPRTIGLSLASRF